MDRSLHQGTLHPCPMTCLNQRITVSEWLVFPAPLMHYASTILHFCSSMAQSRTTRNNKEGITRSGRSILTSDIPQSSLITTNTQRNHQMKSPISMFRLKYSLSAKDSAEQDSVHHLVSPNNSDRFRVLPHENAPTTSYPDNGRHILQICKLLNLLCRRGQKASKHT